MSTNIARFLNMENHKGAIRAGYYADVIVWNPEATFEVTKEIIQHRHKVTPYLGMNLSGKLISTYVNVNLVFDNTECI